MKNISINIEKHKKPIYDNWCQRSILSAFKRRIQLNRIKIGLLHSLLLGIRMSLL